MEFPENILSNRDDSTKMFFRQQVLFLRNCQGLIHLAHEGCCGVDPQSKVLCVAAMAGVVRDGEHSGETHG